MSHLLPLVYLMALRCNSELRREIPWAVPYRLYQEDYPCRHYLNKRSTTLPPKGYPLDPNRRQESRSNLRGLLGREKHLCHSSVRSRAESLEKTFSRRCRLQGCRYS